MRLNTKVVPIDELKDAAYNPRQRLTRGRKKYEQLAGSIEEFGYVEPIVWNEQTGNVVGGHQRLNVLRERAEVEVEVVVVDLDGDQEKLLNLALNKIVGEWDRVKLAAVVADLAASPDSDVDISITGFDGSELDRLVAEAEVDEPEIPFTLSLLEEHQYVVLTFDNTADWEAAKATLGIGPVKALDSRKGYERRGTGRVIRGAPVIARLNAVESG